MRFIHHRHSFLLYLQSYSTYHYYPRSPFFSSFFFISLPLTDRMKKMPERKQIQHSSFLSHMLVLLVVNDILTGKGIRPEAESSSLVKKRANNQHCARPRVELAWAGLVDRTRPSITSLCFSPAPIMMFCLFGSSCSSYFPLVLHVTIG